jgi:hypothetical protein
MKKILLILSLFAMLAMSFISCKKDLGNYDYRELDTIGIASIEKGYTGFTGKPFAIIPTFNTSFKKAIDSTNFRFEWFVHNWAATINSEKKIPLATTRSLDIKLPLGAGSYVIYYRVFDKYTGEMWQTTCNLNVTSEIADGWLVLNEIDGGSRLDMLNYKSATQQFDRYTDLPGSTSDLKLEGKPIQVYYTPNKDIFNNNNYNRVYVSTDRATISINNQSRAWTDYRNFKMEVMRPTDDSYHAKQIVSMGSSTPLTYIIDSDNVLMFENKQQVMLYGAPINRLNTGSPIKIAPYVACFDANRDAFAAFYDVDARRFLIHMGTNKVALVPKSTNASIVNPADMGMDLLYLDCALTATKQFYALLKDPASQNLKLYRFVPSNANFSPLAYDNVASVNQIDRADAYAIDPTYGYLIYSVGSKIYQYDPFNKVHSQLLDLPGRKISLLKYQRFIQNKTSARYKDYASKLMVCTYDDSQPNTSGKMEFYKIQLSGATTLDSSYDGFGKIVSVTYRE